MRKRRRLLIFPVILVMMVIVLPKILSGRQPLEIIHHSPQEETVEVDTAITLELSAPVDMASLAEHFSIDPAVSGQFTADGSTVMFTPDTPLQYSTRYVGSGRVRESWNELPHSFTLNSITRTALLTNYSDGTSCLIN